MVELALYGVWFTHVWSYGETGAMDFELTPRARDRLARVGAVIAAVALVVTTVSIWAERYPLDADRFAAASAVALEDPEVVDALGEVVTDQVVDLVLAVADPRQLLPSQFRNLGGGVENWVREQLAGPMSSLIDNDRVSGWIVAAVRSAHDDVLQLMRDGRSDDGVWVSGSGAVRLDLTAVLAVALDELADRSWIPGIFSDLQDTLRGGLDGFREGLLDATGIDIGADIGTLRVYDDVEVEGGGWALRSARAVTGAGLPLWAVPLLGVVGALGAVAFSTDRRQVLSPFGWSLVLASAGAALYVWRLSVDVENLLVGPGARRGVAIIVDELVGPLWLALAALAVVGAGVALVVRQISSPLLDR